MVLKQLIDLVAPVILLAFFLWALVRGVQNGCKAFKARAWFGVLWSVFWFVALAATWVYVVYSQDMASKFCQTVSWLWSSIAG